MPGLNLRIDESVNERLLRVCSARGTNKSDYCRDALTARLNIDERSPAGSESGASSEQGPYIPHKDNPGIKLIKELPGENNDLGKCCLDSDGIKWRLRPDGHLMPIARVRRD